MTEPWPAPAPVPTPLVVLLTAVLAAAIVPPPAQAQAVLTLDLASVPEGDSRVLRVFGSEGEGRFGLPVAAGHDLDGDG
ncbi:MAG: hypothetical protein MI919_10075, partial [Holophagales bacterium]|nr:hypothetical protein [Holophagales bacterium]